MKRLAFYSLEGLVRQGAHEVWIPLGAYSTMSQARASTGAGKRSDIVDTRVIAHYRDSSLGHAPSSNIRPKVRLEKSSASTVSTVA